MQGTGNATVDEVGKINIQGNIIPHSWYSTITRENGKPYLTAIVILADIVYWYRPAEIRDEQTGRLVGYKKKFKSDKLQRSYQNIADMFGISKKEATSAVVFLEKLGIISREFRTIDFNGLALSNVLFIGLDAERLKDITFEREIGIPEKEGGVPFERERGIPEKGEVYAQSGGTYTKISPEISPQTSTVKKEKAKGSFDKIIEEYTTDEKTVELLKEWLKVRKAKRAAMTDTAIKLNLKKLDTLASESKMSVPEYLEEIICKGWAAFYPIHTYSSNGNTTKQGKTYGPNGVEINPDAVDDLAGIF